jgi:hypothetical protein
MSYCLRRMSASSPRKVGRRFDAVLPGEQARVAPCKPRRIGAGFEGPSRLVSALFTDPSGSDRATQTFPPGVGARSVLGRCRPLQRLLVDREVEYAPMVHALEAPAHWAGIVTSGPAFFSPVSASAKSSIKSSPSLPSCRR